MAYRDSGFGFGSFSLTPVVKRLLIANVAVFVATLALPAGFVIEWFAFHPSELLTKPWGAFTYMFVHGDFMHVFLNMLVLSFALAANASIVGASAATYGLMLAFAMSWPDAPIYVWGIFPVKAKWLVAFFFLMTLFSSFSAPAGPVAHLAHLGGLVTGFIYLKADWRPRSRLDALKRRSTRVRRLAIVPREDEVRPPSTQRPAVWRTADEGELLHAVDRVLDKISAEGMASLTAEERGLLDEVSRRHRTTQ
jgi:membrane associated rhomboid family serine protease